jgi:hypothetical protein
MEIRYFQIIIPIVALFFIYAQYKEYRKSKVGIYETILVVLFWIGVSNLAIFPDFFSMIIAKLFGIKSNINAIIFFALGLLFYFQFQLYKSIKKQDELLTELTRKIALEKYEKK